MNVLVVSKTTNFELHGAKVEAKVGQGRISRDSLARLKLAHDEHYAALDSLRKALRTAGVKFTEISRDEQKGSHSGYDAVITVGGDGTLLSASHHMEDEGFLLGLRSSATSVGYLCCCGADQTEELVRRLIDGTHRVAVVNRLRARVEFIEDRHIFRTSPVLNDFLYTNINPAASTSYRLRFNDQEEHQRSSGIWVATGAGSTAAILAAGGSQRPLDDSFFQFRVRELYRMGDVQPTIQGGLFDPDKDMLGIENRCPVAVLAFDGQHGGVELSYGDLITFERAAPVRLARGASQK